jgi:hypothetical protein
VMPFCFSLRGAFLFPSSASLPCDSIMSTNTVHLDFVLPQALIPARSFYTLDLTVLSVMCSRLSFLVVLNIKCSAVLFHDLFLITRSILQQINANQHSLCLSICASDILFQRHFMQGHPSL